MENFNSNHSTDDNETETDNLSSAHQKSKFYKKAAQKAITVAADKNKVVSLLSKAFLYFQKNESNRPVAEEIKEKFSTLLRLIQALYKKEYSNFPWSSLIKAIAVLIYFVSPIDALPDFVPVLGFIDDFALLSWVLSSLHQDIQNFENWEQEQATLQITE